MLDKVLIGSTRIGPDLIDIGTRRSSRNWHYLHLYNPRITSPGSVMPSFPFLFETIEIVGQTASIKRIRALANFLA